MSKPPATCNNCKAQIIFKQEGLKPDGSKKWIRYDYLSPETRHVCKQVLGDEKPEVTAHNATLKEYANNDQRSADIKKLHDENMTASKELTAAILVLANELQGIKHLVEIAVNNSDMVKKTFQNASDLAKERTA